MYQRLTEPTPEGYRADADAALERLGRLEDRIAKLQAEYDQTVASMEALAAQGKEKTVTYRQLFANKLQLQAMLSYYRTYGLFENEK